MRLLLFLHKVRPPEVQRGYGAWDYRNLTPNPDELTKHHAEKCKFGLDACDEDRSSLHAWYLSKLVSGLPDACVTLFPGELVEGLREDSPFQGVGGPHHETELLAAHYVNLARFHLLFWKQKFEANYTRGLVVFCLSRVSTIWPLAMLRSDPCFRCR